MTDREISDEMLTAYLDDQIEAADRTRIETALSQDTALQARLEMLDIPLDPLRDAMAQIATQAPAITLPATAPARSFPIGIAGGALAAGIVLGALLVTQMTPAPKAPGWIDFVASYQALYSPETLAGIDTDPVQQAAQLSKVSNAVGRPLEIAASVPGLEFKRAQTLGFNGKPLVQMAYVTETGVPLAFCIIAKADEAALEQMERQGLQAASWSDGSHAYLLIGGEDAELISQAAKHLQNALEL